MRGAMRRPLIDVLLFDDAVEALLSDESQLAAMLRVEVALAIAEAAVGLIQQQAAARIEAVVGDFAPDWDDLAEGMRRDGVVVPRLVEQLRRTAGAEHAAALHKGATSQDIVDTALMLQLGSVLELFDKRLGGVLEQLAALAHRLDRELAGAGHGHPGEARGRRCAIGAGRCRQS